MSCLKLGPGDKAPEIVNALIEIPMGGSVKYELDKEHCLIKVDRFLYTSMVYPFNYGFVPGTLAEDGDPIDIIVLSREPIYPGSIIEVKPVGMLIMEDEAGVDTKIIAVPKQKLDPLYGSINDIDDVPDITKDKIKHFFEHYKELEPGKWVKLKDWLSAKNAKEEIVKTVERYGSTH